MAQRRLTMCASLIGLIAMLVCSSAWADLDTIVRELWRDLPRVALVRPIAPPPLALRGPSGVVVYRERVNGVVVIATKGGVGTGSLISTSGDIITAEHVVQNSYRTEGAEWVLVWFKPRQGVEPDKDQFLPARVISRDPVRDLAHIRLARPSPQDARVIPLATNLPEVGQDVFSIGHPETYFWTFTQGVVSQVRPNYTWLYSDNNPRVATVIQTQTPTNPGSSGGPLLDEQGALVGIIVSGVPDAPGLYFAVAVQHVQALLQR